MFAPDGIPNATGFISFLSFFIPAFFGSLYGIPSMSQYTLEYRSKVFQSTSCNLQSPEAKAKHLGSRLLKSALIILYPGAAMKPADDS